MGLVLSSNAAIADADATTFPPRFGVNNLFRASEAAVTVSAEDTANDGHKENAYAEGFTHDFWKPGSSGDHWIRLSLSSSAKADYLAIAAHDLNTAVGSVKAQYSTDGGSSWNDAHTATTPGTSQPLMVLFDEVEAADWQLHVSADSAFRIGVVHIGLTLKPASGIRPTWTPPYLGRDIRHTNDRTEGGAFSGRSIVAKGAELQLHLSHLEPDWVRNTWEPNVRLIEQYPFFFAARDVGASGGREKEVVYAWTTRQPSSRYISPIHAEIDLQAQALID